MFKDEQEVFYTELEPFMYRLEEVQRNTSWKFIPAKELSIGSSESFSWVLDDQEPIRNHALSSLYQRLGLGGKIMDRLSNDALHEIVNFGIEHAPKSTLRIPIVEGKVNAFLSNQYSSLPAIKVFEEVVKFLNEKAEGFTFNGVWSYIAATGEFHLPLEKMVDGVPYSTVLVAKTSDAGFSSVNFSAYLDNGSYKLPIMSDLSLIHKGIDEEKLIKLIKMLDGAIDTGVKKLNRLLLVNIYNPKATMKRVAKKVNLPKKDTLQLIEEYEPTVVNTAFDLYMQLSKLLNNTHGWSQKEKLQGDLYKLLGIDWGSYDLAGDYPW